MLTVPNDFLLLHVSRNVFQEDSLNDLPRNEVRLTTLQGPWIVLLAFF